MIRRTWRWLSSAYPHGVLLGVVLGIVALYVGEWLFMGVLWLIYGATPDGWKHLLGYRIGILTVLAAVAMWRSVHANPAYNELYRRWLCTTPWTPDKRLPYGSVEPTMQDGVLIAAAMIAWASWPGAWYVPLAFLLPYSAALTRLNFRAGKDAAVFAAAGLAALLPLSLLQLNWPWLPAAMAGLIFLATLAGWRLTRADYPWEYTRRWKHTAGVGGSAERDKAVSAWWPRVHPWPNLDLAPMLTWRQVLMGATLAGWFAGVATFTAQFFVHNLLQLDDGGVIGAEIPVQIATATTLGIGIAFAIVRLIFYALWCAPPISLAGRWATRRWIIAGYDRVLIPSALAVAVSVALPIELGYLDCPLAISAFATVFLATAAALGLGPTLADWSLTGEYRMVLHNPPASRGRRRGGAMH